MDLGVAERRLRRYDKLLRLRHSLVGPNILVERKTYVGRIGALLPDGEAYLPDSGYRKEWGHVHVAAIHEDVFDPVALLDSLKLADTWHWGESRADKIEREDAMKAADKKRNRESELRYRAANLWSNYVRKYKQRIYGGLG